MFDTRNKASEANQQNMIQSMEGAKRNYDRQLFSDWIVKVFQRCSVDCLQPIDKTSEETPAAQLSEFEKNCATNCVRKHERAYQLYGKLEENIFTSHMEATDVDPQ